MSNFREDDEKRKEQEFVPDEPLSPGERELFEKLTSDLKEAGELLSQDEARFLVDQYYAIQDMRIRAFGQVRSKRRKTIARNLARHVEKKSEAEIAEWLKATEIDDKAYVKVVEARGDIPKGKAMEFVDFFGCSVSDIDPHLNEFFTWVGHSQKKLENVIKAALGRFAARYTIGRWCQAQVGIGPVLSAAFLAHFDIRKARTCGAVWRFAGLDPTLVWNKGEKRPYNAMLKSVCVFKAGECFVKTQNKQDSYYGKLFASKKEDLAFLNESGKLKDVAEAELEKYKDHKSMKNTQRWKHWQTGKIAPAHVHDRARRWAVKIFIQDLFDRMYKDFHGIDPPAPYVFAFPEKVGEHVHKLVKPITVAGLGGESLKTLYDREDKQVGEPLRGTTKRSL